MEFNRYSLPFFDRNGFPPWLVGLIWSVVAWLLFQGVGAVYMLGSMIVQGMSLTEDLVDDLMANASLMLVGNSVGQFVVLGLGTLLIAFLSVRKEHYMKFMRFRMPRGGMKIIVLSVLLMLVSQPVIWMFSWLNSLIPLPDVLNTLEQSQIEMLQHVLTSGLSVWFLLFAVAVTPAICEEIMFRSYLMRLFENSAGIIWAIVISGILFGLFHVRLSQLIPLSVIGILLAWVTWQSGSIIPAIIMHLVHNGGTVLVVHNYPELATMDSAEALPHYGIVISGFVLTILLIYLYMKWSTPKPEDGYVQ